MLVQRSGATPASPTFRSISSMSAAQGAATSAKKLERDLRHIQTHGLSNDSYIPPNILCLPDGRVLIERDPSGDTSKDVFAKQVGGKIHLSFRTGAVTTTDTDRPTLANTNLSQEIYEVWKKVTAHRNREWIHANDWYSLPTMYRGKYGKDPRSTEKKAKVSEPVVPIQETVTDDDDSLDEELPAAPVPSSASVVAGSPGGESSIPSKRKVAVEQSGVETAKDEDLAVEKDTSAPSSKKTKTATPPSEGKKAFQGIEYFPWTQEEVDRGFLDKKLADPVWCAAKDQYLTFCAEMEALGEQLRR